MELAKYVLARLADNQSIEKLAEEFDNDVPFINGVIEFLKYVGWIKQHNNSGSYQITKIGRMKANSLKMIVWI